MPAGHLRALTGGASGPRGRKSLRRKCRDSPGHPRMSGPLRRPPPASAQGPWGPRGAAFTSPCLEPTSSARPLSTEGTRVCARTGRGAPGCMHHGTLCLPSPTAASLLPLPPSLPPQKGASRFLCWAPRPSLWALGPLTLSHPLAPLPAPTRPPEWPSPSSPLLPSASEPLILLFFFPPHLPALPPRAHPAHPATGRFRTCVSAPTPRHPPAASKLPVLPLPAPLA